MKPAKQNINSKLNGDLMKGILALNEYLIHIDILNRECTNIETRREYWIKLYRSIQNNKLETNIGTEMVLIHPIFEDVEVKSRYGFKATISGRCELGKLIHGAICPNIAKEKDHVFPWSLGGITSDVNRADLCQSCNRGKSNTVVGYFPWNESTPAWVNEEIWKTRKRMGF